jgi:hypothetical protein
MWMSKLKAPAMLLVMLSMLAITCGMLSMGQTEEKSKPAENLAARTDDKPKKEAGSKPVKGLVALAELTEKPEKGAFEVRLSLKNVSDKPITVCDCIHLASQIQVQWLGPDGKLQKSKHNDYPGSNFTLKKSEFVAIQPGEVRRIVPTVRFHTSRDKLGPDPEMKLPDPYALDLMMLAERSNLVGAGEHRVRVSFTNTFVRYPAGPGPNPTLIPVDNVWTGTVTANEVIFKVK